MSDPLLDRIAEVRTRRRHRCRRVPCWTCDRLERQLALIQSEVEQLLVRTVDDVPAHITLHAS